MGGFLAWLAFGLLLSYGPLMLLDAATSAQAYLRQGLASMEPLEADLGRLKTLLRNAAKLESSRSGPPSRPGG